MALYQQEWNWARKLIEKLSMTVKQGITFVSPDFNFITKKKKKINKIMTKDDTSMRKKKGKDGQNWQQDFQEVHISES